MCLDFFTHLRYVAPMETVTISTFYSFVALENPSALKAPILARMKELGIKGTITLATEGVNATISGAAESIESLMAFLKSEIAFTTPTYRTSHFSAQPFKRTKVKVKRELISLGVKSEPALCVGQYVMPENWNTLITDKDVVIIDTRNDYEYALGHFEGAINPATRSFKQMIKFAEQHIKSSQKIAMYCTGGIRCEKYSSYLVANGHDEVYHLHGGILAYLETIPEPTSLWRGKCFVFDERISVTHGLKVAA